MRHLRQEKKLSREDLAERTGLPVAELAKIEGGGDDPVWGDMRRVAAGLGVSLEELADLAERFEGGDLL